MAPPSRILELSGLEARIIPDAWLPGAHTLVVDGTPQSHVNLGDPTHLHFEYVQRIGHLIDQLGLPGQPLTALHLGAGALTVPRYVEATRSGSRQQVIELERDLVDFVREHLPWDRAASLRLRYGDAREVLGRLPEGLRGTVDVIVVDIFTGARTPAHVTSAEFFALAAGFLAPAGVIIVNAADEPGHRFVRGQAATLGSVLGHVALMAEPAVLKGRRFGNFVLTASHAALPLDRMPRLLAGGPHPAQLLTGRELRDFVAGALPVTDASAVPSPMPVRSVFQPRV